MDAGPDLLEDQRCRAVAAADIIALALERNLLHMAMSAAQEAARAAQLVLAAAPRRPAGPVVELLREMAAAPPQHLAGRPAEREARVRATLAVVLRLFAEARPPIGGRQAEPHARAA